MKRKSLYYLRHVELFALCAGLFTLNSGSALAWARASVAGNKTPVFREVPSAPSAQPAAPTPAPRSAIEPAPAAPKPLYKFRAVDLELKSALALFARENDLNIIAYRDVAGTVTLDVHDLPLDQVMMALLEANDCSYVQDGGLIRVRTSQTRTFTVDYLRLSRTGTGNSQASLTSGGGGGTGSGGSSSTTGNSTVNLTANNPVDFWKELKAELNNLLTEQGRASLAVNMTAGIIQLTDRPSALKKVESYLRDVDRSIHRQVDLDARIYDVSLNNQFQFGIDWVHVAKAYGGSLGFGAATLPVANGGNNLGNSILNGTGSGFPNATPTLGGGSPHTMVFNNINTTAAINALQEQGSVEVVSKPRVRTLNNQTAIVKVGEDQPFFAASSTTIPQATGPSLVQQNVTVNSITIGTILYLTPQISDDNWIALDISPVFTSLIEVKKFSDSSSSSGGSSGTTAPDLNSKQISTLVRVHDGDTIVIGGLIQDEISKNETKIPLLGDIPGLGKLFTGTYRSKKRKELVMFITPHIVREGQEPALPAAPSAAVQPSER